MSLSENNKRSLLDLAYRSIEMGLKTGHPLNIDLREYSGELSRQKATFVTLEKDHILRGCMGMLEPVLPLAEDVCENAYSAAYKDPRFPPVKKVELKDLTIVLSVLSKPEAIQFCSEEDLILQLRPELDGLILQCGSRTGTFLPTVWKTLPLPEHFLQHLKQKAGLKQNYWSDQIKVFRYTTELIF